MLIHTHRFWKCSAPAALLVLTVVSCQPATEMPTPTPLIQTVEVTQEVTRQVTSEVTRVVEVPVPVTVTPSLTPVISQTPSLTATITRTPTITLTPEPPVAIILQDHVACNFGPGGAYLLKYGLLATSWMWVIGRNDDGTWLFVEGEGRNPCWVKEEYVRFKYGGDAFTNNIQTVSPDIILPFATNLYLPPTGIQAIRFGNEVKIFWNAVWMTEDDYRGYLIEAWLCQDGQQVFKPINKFPPLDENVGTLVLSVTDETGCQIPSHARIYTVEKHGYSGYIVIPWPPYQPTPTP
jgi:hypothetical protein